MSLDFHHSFGFKGEINHPVAFYSEKCVIFSAGKLCVLFDLETKNQKVFRFTDRCEVTALTRHETHLAAAIRGSPPSVCLFNLLSETKKMYYGPSTLGSEIFTVISISVTLKFIAAQGGPPDWALVIWFTQTREVAATLNPASQRPGSVVWDISFHAADRDEFVVVGQNVFRLYEYQEQEADIEAETGALFSEHVFEKHEDLGEYFSICWPFKENLAIGTSTGEVLFFRGIEPIYEIDVSSDVLNSLTEDKSDTVLFEQSSKSLNGLTISTAGFLCVYSGRIVVVYEGEEITEYKLSQLIFMPPNATTKKIAGELQSDEDSITDITLSPMDKYLIATTKAGQLLVSNYKVGGKQQVFVELLQRQHSDSILGMDIACAKPLIATCSKECVIVWNFETKTQEMRKRFRNEILCVALHPTGLYLAVGFNQHCRIFSVQYSGLDEREMIQTRDCSRISFSTGGHLLALVNNLVIQMHCFVTFTLLAKLNGHAGKITCFAWKENDTQLISCDARGVVCAWDLVSWRKQWENTTVLSYSSIAVNQTGGMIFAVASGNILRCLANAEILREIKSSKELTTIGVSSSGAIYTGACDGCIEASIFSLTERSDPVEIYAHSGKVTEIKLSCSCKMAITVGSDGMIFCWKTKEQNPEEHDGAFSSLVLVSSSDIEKQEEKMQQLRMSLRHLETATDCEMQLNEVRHRNRMGQMAIDHELSVIDLNEKIANIKEEMQVIIFDYEPKVDLIEIENAMRREMVNATIKLDEAYKRSNAYAEQTRLMIQNYENTMESLNTDLASSSSAEYSKKEELMEKIKTLEDVLAVEREITRKSQMTCEEYKKRILEEIDGDVDGDNLKDSQREMLEREKQRSKQLKYEAEKLKQLATFQREDTLRRRNVSSGQVDHDLFEKVNAVTVLQKDFHKLETILEAKEKIARNQEIKFVEARKSVGTLQRCHSVSKTAIEELKQEIQQKEEELKQCKEEIKEVKKSIPKIEEEIQINKDLCSTVTEKLKETVDGFRKKQKFLRDAQDVVKRYMALLHKCLSTDCDPVELKDRILRLFEQSKSGIADEAIDSNLRDDYAFQIAKLQKSYNEIKTEPGKAMQEKSMAEFRLSQENSKILRDVHEMQKKIEKLRETVYEMDLAMGIPPGKQVRSTKQTEELRNKIEFVVAGVKKNREEKAKEIEKLDMLIEEQQKELERFHVMLAAKTKKAKKKKYKR